MQHLYLCNRLCKTLLSLISLKLYKVELKDSETDLVSLKHIIRRLSDLTEIIHVKGYGQVLLAQYLYLTIAMCLL